MCSQQLFPVVSSDIKNTAVQMAWLDCPTVQYKSGSN